jgi:hypothetical protein
MERCDSFFMKGQKHLTAKHAENAKETGREIFCGCGYIIARVI